MTKEELSQNRSRIHQIFNYLSGMVDGSSKPSLIAPSPLSSKKATTYIGQGYALWKEAGTVPLVHISSHNNQINLVYLDGALAQNWFAPTQSSTTGSYSYEIDKSLRTAQQKQLDVLFSIEEIASVARCFCLSPDGKALLWGGNYDNSFKSTNLDNMKQTRSFYSHSDIVTCIHLGKDGDTLLTGSKDTTVRLWSLKSLLSKNKAHVASDFIFRGHVAPVTCVDLDLNLGVMVSDL